MGLIVLHLGAGDYSSREADIALTKLMDTAMVLGVELLRDEKQAAQEIACRVLAELEKSPMVNAGFGSNLTRTGIVECDAGVAFCRPGECSPRFASIGAAPGLDSPSLATLELLHETESLTAMLPSMSPTRMLAGTEAWAWARKRGISSAKTENDLPTFHVTQRALSSWQSARDKLESLEDEVHCKRQRCDDTIGCICIDSKGTLAVACSSGGPVMRLNGRVGPAAVFGMGFCAGSNVAVCTTGSSDFICRSLLARSAMDPKTLESILPPRTTDQQVGLLRVRMEEKIATADWTFTSLGMAIGYATEDELRSEVFRKETPNGSMAFQL